VLKAAATAVNLFFFLSTSQIRPPQKKDECVEKSPLPQS
jgi:hypothetical protein